jgi:3-hydroxybutyrate dehydrogenase
MTLKGKVALVTGSTSGIGLALARALAAEGADIMMNGFGEPARIASLREEIAAASGGERGLFGGGRQPAGRGRGHGAPGG